MCSAVCMQACPSSPCLLWMQTSRFTLHPIPHNPIPSLKCASEALSPAPNLTEDSLGDAFPVSPPCCPHTCRRRHGHRRWGTPVSALPIRLHFPRSRSRSPPSPACLSDTGMPHMHTHTQQTHAQVLISQSRLVLYQLHSFLRSSPRQWWRESRRRRLKYAVAV